MPELPGVSEDFTADASGYLAAIQAMIDRTQDLVDLVNELHADIDALPVVKNIEITITGDAVETVETLHEAIDDLPDVRDIELNVTGDALDVITAIKTDLDSLDNRIVEVNVIYKNIGGPEEAGIEEVVGVTETAPATGGETAAEIDAMAIAAEELAAASGGADDEVGQLADEIHDLVEKAVEGAITMAELATKIMEITGGVAELRAATDEATQGLDDVGEAAENTAGSMDSELQSSIKNIIAQMGEENLTAKQQAGIWAQLGYAQQQLGSSTDELSSQTAQLAEAQRQAAAEVAEISAAEEEAAKDAEYYTQQTQDEIAAETQIKEALLQHIISLGELGDASDSVVTPTDKLSAIIQDAGGDFKAFDAAIADGTPSMLAFAEAAKDMGDNVGGVLIPISLATFGITGWGTAIHLIVMGTFEFLAVFVPAMYAAAAAAAVLSQGFTYVYDGLKSVEDVGESLGPMFGETQGDMIGLGHSLQVAQNAADPTAYILLGEAIMGVDDATGHADDALSSITHTSGDASQSISSFGQLGLDVGHELDEFGAKVDADLGDNFGQVTEVLSKAGDDLTEFGQILGNIGHAILNLAADMPGLAEIILKVIDGFSDLIKWVTELPPTFVAVVMGFEEAYRWSGLLAGGFSLLGRAIGLLGTLGVPVIAKIGLNMGTMVGSMLNGVGAAVVNLTAMGEKIGLMGSLAPNLSKVGDEAAMMSGEVAEGGGVIDRAAAGLVSGLGDAAAFMEGPWGAAIMIGVAGMVALAIAEGHATNATEQFIAAGQQAVAQATNLTVLNVIGEETYDTTQKLAAAQQVLNTETAQATVLIKGKHRADTDEIGALDQQASAVAELSSAQQKYIGETASTLTNATTISKTFGISFTSALALADVAGINLSQTTVKFGTDANNAGVQIEALVLGYEKMDQSGTTLANSMNAVNVEAGIQASKISTVNTAWDDFISNLTGLTGNFASLQDDLQQMGNVSTATGDKIQAFSGSTTLSVSQIAQALTSFGGSSSQVWQSFNASISDAEQWMDSLRTAAAAGVIQWPQYQAAIAGVVNELIPYAQQSEAAKSEVIGLAEEAGYSGSQNMQTLNNWIKQTGGSTINLTSTINTLTAKMSNVTQVAANFAGTLQSDVAGAVANAAVGASSITKLTQEYTTALQANGATASSTASLHNQLVAVLTKELGSATSATQLVNILTNAYGNNSSAVYTNTGTLSANEKTWNDFASTAGPNGVQALTNLHVNSSNLTQALTEGQSPAVDAAGSAIDNMGQKAGATASGPLSDLNQITQDLNKWTADFEKIANDWPKTENTTVHVTGTGGAKATSNVPGVIQGIFNLFGLAQGGVIPGYAPGQDTVPALLSPGEGVLTPQAVRAIGGEGAVSRLNMNAQHFAGGGIVLPNVTGWAQDVLSTATKGITQTFAYVLQEGMTQMVKESEYMGTAIAGSAFQNLVSIAKYLMAHGLTAIAAAGIAGTIYGESGGNPEAVGDGGFGLIGWTGNTIGLPSGYTGPTGNATYDLDVQMGGVLGYIMANGGIGMLNAQSNVVSAGDYFSEVFERPAVLYSDTRPGIAEEVYAAIAGGGSSTPAPASGLGTKRITQDAGGWLYPGLNLIENKTGQIERTVPPGENGGQMLHAEISIDGRKLFDAMTPYAYQKASRNNGNANAGSYWTPGSR